MLHVECAACAADMGERSKAVRLVIEVGGLRAITGASRACMASARVSVRTKPNTLWHDQHIQHIQQQGIAL